MENQTREKYHPRSAAVRMVSNVPTAGKEESAGSILARLEKDSQRFSSVDYIYVVEEDSTLLGAVPLRDIISAPKKKAVGEFIRAKPVSVQPETDLEKVADLAVKHNIKDVPVVMDRKLVGVVVTDAILSTLNRALREDVLHLAGIHKAHLEYENTMAVPLAKSIIHRLPWLLVGLVGITAAALFISLFEYALQKHLILAFFIPALVYMSDAIGTQHQTLFVRDLAIMGRELDIKKYFARQIAIGMLIGVIIGIVVFAFVSLIWKEPFVAFVIAVSMFVTLTVSSISALATTLVINKLRLDPALGSGPFATIFSDVTTIVIYFFVAISLLGI